MTWQQQQTRFAKAVRDPSQKVPEFVQKTAGKPSQKRFNVYRNNVMVSLTDAILDAYPVVARLVGEEFATAMARVFVTDNLPISPVMLHYGEGYATFIESFEPTQSLPFLADVARLERAWLQAYHAADHIPLTIDVLAQIPPDELSDLNFRFCPGVQLLSSKHPISSLWSAHQDDQLQGLDKLPTSGEAVLVNRPHYEVSIRVLEPGFFTFLTSLSKGKSLGQSIDKGNTHARFDPAKAIQTLFETQTVCALKTEPQNET